MRKTILLLGSMLSLILCGCRPANKDGVDASSGQHTAAAIEVAPAFDPNWEELPPDFESRLKFYSGGEHDRTRQFGIIGTLEQVSFPRSKIRLLDIRLHQNDRTNSPSLSRRDGIQVDGAWIGQNAFGAKVVVTEKTLSENWYYLDNFETFRCLEFRTLYLGGELTYIRTLVSVPEDKVELRYLLLFTERAPSSRTGPFETDKATFSAPVQLNLDVTHVHCNVTSIWIFDATSRKVYRKLDLTEPTGWETELMRVAEMGDGDAANWFAERAAHEPQYASQELDWRRIAAAAGNTASQKVLTNYSNKIAVLDLRDRIDHGDALAAITLSSINRYGSFLYYTEDAERIAKAFFAARTDPRVQEFVRELRLEGRARDEKILQMLSALEKDQAERERQERIAKMQSEAIALAKQRRVETEARVLRNHQELAEKGTPYGQYSMGMRYLKGDGVERDEDRARDLFEKAAAQGHLDSQRELDKFKSKER
jgi:hypothetical protein